MIFNCDIYLWAIIRVIGKEIHFESASIDRPVEVI